MPEQLNTNRLTQVAEAAVNGAKNLLFRPTRRPSLRS